MNKTILVSLSLITVVGVIATGVTISFLSDTEKSIGNTLAIGTIDISVAGQNPWNTTYPMLLDKPCQTNYMNFTIKNVGTNPVNVWKRIMNVATDGGDSSFCGVASSEPEYTEGGGTFDASGNCVVGGYIERDNLSAYVVYDMYFCYGVVNTSDCPVLDSANPATSAPDLTTGKWIVIIPETNQVRIDNVNGIWIKLDNELEVDEPLAVSQSYHLMAWDDAGVETITNWAQGDKMTFDIELEARQISAPAPTSEGSGLLTLKAKDGDTWEPNGATGTLTYNTSGSTFDYDFTASGLNPTTSYDLIYYADPWSGNHPGKLIGTHTTDGIGSINDPGQIVNLGMDLPDSADANYPVGAKIWLVLSSDYTEPGMADWHPSEYLFEMNLITYDDTDI
ncbi:hypothetical protein KAW43_03585 [Candidatus Parcubacteria bacterium]|nr:hypothetical protein [Candidatus Parcubacteria bacterium]